MDILSVKDYPKMDGKSFLSLLKGGTNEELARKILFGIIRIIIQQQRL
ncbi:MAG: hypothetical protein R2757_18075 [Draconibacterium sp.]